MKKYLRIFAVFVGGFFSAPSWIMYVYAYLHFVGTAIFAGNVALEALAFFLLIVFPISIVIALNQLKVIEDVDSRDKSKRLIVMTIFTGLMLALVAFSLILGNLELIKFLLLIILPAVIGAIINKFWLLSVHVMSSAASVTIMAYLSGWPFYLLYLVVILVAWARVEEKKHTIAQVIAGGVLGLAVTLFLLNQFFSPLQFQL